MNKILFALLFVAVVGCKSEATKNKEKMITLLNQHDSIVKLFDNHNKPIADELHKVVNSDCGYDESKYDQWKECDKIKHLKMDSLSRLLEYANNPYRPQLDSIKHEMRNLKIIMGEK